MVSRASDVQTGYLLITVAWRSCCSYCPANRGNSVQWHGNEWWTGETVWRQLRSICNYYCSVRTYACYCTNTRKIGRGGFCRNRDLNKVMKRDWGMLASTPQHPLQNFCRHVRSKSDVLISSYLSLVLHRNTEFRIHIPFLGIFVDWPCYKYGFQRKSYRKFSEI